MLRCSVTSVTDVAVTGRVWDIRTGRSITALQGHVKGILSMDFSPDGYHLATGSEDHSCRIWDLRKRSCVYVLPAHRSLISQVITLHCFCCSGTKVGCCPSTQLQHANTTGKTWCLIASVIMSQRAWACAYAFVLCFVCCVLLVLLLDPFCQLGGHVMQKP